MGKSIWQKVLLFSFADRPVLWHCNVIKFHKDNGSYISHDAIVCFIRTFLPPTHPLYGGRESSSYCNLRKHASRFWKLTTQPNIVRVRSVRVVKLTKILSEFASISSICTHFLAVRWALLASVLFIVFCQHT